MLTCLGDRSRSFVVLLPLLGVLAACGGASSPAPSAAPSAVALREIAACDPAVAVPEDSVSTMPAADPPPTVTATVGQAVLFQVPRGGRVGLLGDTSSDEAQLCTSSTATARTVVLVATGTGYSRIGVQVGIQAPLEVLVRVNPA